MELSRRDALGALSTVGVSLGAGTALLAESWRNQSEGDARPDPGEPFGEHERQTMVLIARVVYPSAVTGIEPFVSTYLDRRTAARPAVARGIAETVSTLDKLGRDWYGGAFVDLGVDTGDRLLRAVGAETADADPAGTTAERVRYHLVNELLFAFYASPTGARLVGLENPQGHPGGVASYQRGSPK